MKKFAYLLAGAVLAFSMAPVHATNFLGNQIKAGWRLPSESTPFAVAVTPSNIFTVGAGVEAEAQLTALRFLIDFSRHDLTLTFLTNATFTTNTFNGLYLDALTGDGFGTIKDVSGIAVDRIHNMGSALSVNFSGQHYSAGDKVVIDFASGVPEGETWAMLVMGLGAAGALLRRETRRSVAFS